MSLLSITRLIAIAGLLLGVLGIAFRLNDIMNRPFRKDLSRGRGSRWRGVLNAFTLGMAPWEKESGRLHWDTYIRGVLFHLGVFVTFAVLLASPWLGMIPRWIVWLAVVITAAGALAGFIGAAMRRLDKNERALSVPDDYFSVALTALFVALACLTLLAPAVLPVFYLVSAITLAYIPFSKIRHCVYFFYAKFFFGQGYGHRGVIGQAGGKSTH
ncbi:MAG: hypothetical protein NT169_16690 [Chloroflexi bacterium]|nr:hypothetical protein [Chloroflexota bacterium]